MDQHDETTSLAFDRITSNPGRLGGKPCIRDLRISVQRVVEAVALYGDRAELLREYPELEDEDVRQALRFAAASLDAKTPASSAS